MKKIIPALLASAFLCSTTHAAIISAFDYQNSMISPWYHDSNVAVSDLTLNGGLTYVSTFTPTDVRGWTPSAVVNTAQSMSFTIEAAQGYQMELTSLKFGAAWSGNTAAEAKLTNAAWGYRVDNGSGYGAWTLYTFALLSVGEAGRPEWTFDQPVIVGDGGTVEFGFFAWGATATGGRVAPKLSGTGDDMIVNGTVSAVPEPSSLLMGLTGALALFRRRRA